MRLSARSSHPFCSFDATDPTQKRRLNHGTAFLTRIGTSNRYFVMSEVGDLLVVELTPEKYVSKGRTRLLGEGIRHATVTDSFPGNIVELAHRVLNCDIG